MAATLTLYPSSRCRWDEPVRIVVRGLAQRQRVTLRASLRDEKGALFQAHARYCADAGGELDLTRAPALGGSFAGLEPMGLFWALEPERPFWKFLKRDVQTPFVLELEVVDGHEPEGGCLLARALHERHFLPPGVQRVPVRAGRVRATLFLPPGEPGLPGVNSSLRTYLVDFSSLKELVFLFNSGSGNCFLPFDSQELTKLERSLKGKQDL